MVGSHSLVADDQTACFVVPLRIADHHALFLLGFEAQRAGQAVHHDPCSRERTSVAVRHRPAKGHAAFESNRGMQRAGVRAAQSPERLYRMLGMRGSQPISLRKADLTEGEAPVTQGQDLLDCGRVLELLESGGGVAVQRNRNARSRSSIGQQHDSEAPRGPILFRGLRLKQRHVRLRALGYLLCELGC